MSEHDCIYCDLPCDCGEFGGATCNACEYCQEMIDADDDVSVDDYN